MTGEQEQRDRFSYALRQAMAANPEKGRPNVSNRQLSTAIGVDARTIAKWRKGLALPNLFESQRLAMALKVDETLFREPPEVPVPPPYPLEIPRPTSKFKRTLKEIAWSARFSETAGSTTLTIVLARVGQGGSEELLVSEDVQISNPDFDTIANSADLAGIADNKAGTYVLRYLRESTILAEGTFRLVK
jgi:transcriptional regulator with XRE-family HTH domain